MSSNNLENSLQQNIQSYQCRLESICSYQNSVRKDDIEIKEKIASEKRMLLIYIHILKGLHNILLRKNLIPKSTEDKDYLDGYIEGILKGTTIASELLLESLTSNSDEKESAELATFRQIFNTFSTQVWKAIDDI